MSNEETGSKSDVCPECGSNSKKLRYFKQTGPYTVADTRCANKWHDKPAPSEHRPGAILAPYPNCSYQICDLPGQCVSEGACHHPKEPAPAAPVSATPRTIDIIGALNHMVNTASREKMLALRDGISSAIEELGRELAEAKESLQFFKPELLDRWRSANKCNKDLAAMTKRAAELQKQLDDAQKAMETLREDMLNKVMAATDDQIEAAIRLEGRDPKDVAALTRQALTNALHTVEMNKLQAKLAAETARADGAHNAAIDAVIGHKKIGLYDKQRAQIAALKVPQ